MGQEKNKPRSIRPSCKDLIGGEGKRGQESFTFNKKTGPEGKNRGEEISLENNYLSDSEEKKKTRKERVEGKGSFIGARGLIACRRGAL